MLKMKIVFLLVAFALAWENQADEQMELNRRSKTVQSFIAGFFKESDGISNEDCEYFPTSGTFSNNQDIIKLSRLLNNWMCDSPIIKLLAQTAGGSNQLMRTFLKAVESKSKEETKTGSNNVAKDVPLETTTAAAVKKLAKEELVLYVGSDEENSKHVDIYDLVDDSKGFTKRTSLPISGQEWLVVDATGKLLITVANNKLDVYKLNGGTGQPTLLKSNPFTKPYRVAAFDNSGKYLLVSSNSSPADLDAMELKDDGSLNVVDTYKPAEKNDAYPKTFAVHPKAKGILAVPYTGANVVRFLQFNSEAKTITLFSSNAFVKEVCWVVFSPDGQYMYATNYDNVIHAYKITVDNDKNEVTQVNSIGTFGTREVVGSDNMMVISQSGKFLYLLSLYLNKVFIYTIETSSGKLTPDGDLPTGGQSATHAVISPEGTKLVVTDNNAGLIIFNIKEDGKLEQPKVMTDTKQPTVLLLTKKK